MGPLATETWLEMNYQKGCQAGTKRAPNDRLSYLELCLRMLGCQYGVVVRDHMRGRGGWGGLEADSHGLGTGLEIFAGGAAREGASSGERVVVRLAVK